MNIEAPTFNALNKPQKRALILRDQLRFLDPYHLDSFLQGVSDNEPPTYTKLNSVIKPKLALVTLKEEASYFDLGNVLFSEMNNAVHRVYLVAEDSQIQMRMEDPLPLDNDVLDSLPIHGFIARGMIPLFKEKFLAIQSRMNKINEARRVAYKMTDRTPIAVPEGETPSKPNPVKTKQVPTLLPSKSSVKPKPNQKDIQHIYKSISEDVKNTTLDVKLHISNKRKRAALDTVMMEEENCSIRYSTPEETKSRILDTISNDTKISLFNTIVNTTFPHLENLITASHNVVSIYSTCSSDITALQGSIDALKNALQDFDEKFCKPVDRETLSRRHDLEESSHSKETGTQSISTKHNSASGICQTTSSVNHPTSRPKKTFKLSNPVPLSIPAISQPAQPDLTASNQFSESSVLSSSSSSSPKSIPHMNPGVPPSNSNTPQHPSPSLLRTSDSHKTYTNITALHQESVLRFQSSTTGTAAETRRTSSPGGVQEGFLGNSSLGARKTGTHVAPVVNMVPVVRRRDVEGEEEEDYSGMEI